ncbi:MAG: sigma-70 family RNA polymerase sigma factor [Armatimonadetes bacterium]|nr:sigma-70 family RNA polymerase sigma factor [Armatimonadota bacterium]
MPESEEATVRLAQRGDREAFRELFERHRDPVYGYVRQMVRDEDLAADLTQDVFLRAYRSLPRLKAPGAFRGWLYAIAANRVRDHWRSPRLDALSLDASADDGSGDVMVADPAPGPERVAVREGLREAVAAAVEKLAPERREVVVLHHLQGMDVRAIAGMLGVAEGTVKSRLGRARADMRRHLMGWMEE